MRERNAHLGKWIVSLAVMAALCAGTPVRARAQAVPAQDNTVNDATRNEIVQFDQFLDSHPEIAEQLRKDPSLVDNRAFAQNHPALQTYLEDHPAIRNQVKSDPNAFMRREDNFDRRDNPGDRDIDRGELARFDQFLDSHHEIAEQLRKDPSLVDNRAFAQNHPALQTYLQDHPAMREQIKSDPNAFMRHEDNFDRRDDRDNHDFDRGQLASFRKFLDGHSNISQDLSKNPSLAKNPEYVENHGELRGYLKDNPGVRDQLMQNPQDFVRSSKQFDVNNNGWNAKPGAPDAKPNPDAAPANKPKL